MLDKYGVELIGAKIDAIKKAEDRLLFKDAMRKIGLETAAIAARHQCRCRRRVREQESDIRVILRPSFTLGGTGGGIAYNNEELEEFSSAGSTFAGS